MLQEALNSAREAGAEIEMITVADKQIQGCDGCESCAQTKKCKIMDNMQDTYPKLLEADGIIFGTPVYFFSVSAQAKAVLDRTYCLKWQGSLRNKVGAVVTVAARVGNIGAINVFSSYFNAQRMIWAGCVMAFGKRDKGDVRNDLPGMVEANALGRSVVRYVKGNMPDRKV